MTKKCGVCLEAKGLDAFGKNRSAKDGLQTVCRMCRKDKNARSVARLTAVRERASAAEKVCIECKQLKSLDEFHLRTNSTDGRESRCVPCYRARRSEYHKLNPPHKRDPEGYRAMWHNYNARKKNAPGVITKEVVALLFEVYGRKCLACGSEDSVTIDHIVPISRGGTNLINNLQPLCKSCNSSKGNRNSLDYRPFVFDFAFEENGVNI